MTKRSLLTALALMMVLGSTLFATSQSHADSNSVNFETPTYAIGVINGQDGWTSTGAAGSGCAVYDHAVSGSLGTTGFGTQSLRISNAVTSGCFGDQTFAKPLVDAVGETLATAGSFPVGTRQTRFEMQFEIASTVPTAQQSGLSISMSPDRGDGSRMSYLRFDDLADGIHVIFADVTSAGLPGTDVFNLTDIATLDRSVPHTIKLTFDAVDGPSNDVVKVWVDGVLKIIGTSWEDYYWLDAEASAEQTPRLVRTVIFRSAGTAVPANAGKGYLFDNLNLTSGPTVGPPTSKDQCKDNGWKTFNNPTFTNQGQCVSSVASKK